jgi:hypothetical protein
MQSWRMIAKQAACVALTLGLVLGGCVVHGYVGAGECYAGEAAVERAGAEGESSDALVASEPFRSAVASGELGAALDVANGVTDIDQRSRLLAEVAQAQRAWGDHSAAWTTAGRIPAAAVRNETFQQLSLPRGRDFFGGGSGGEAGFGAASAPEGAGNGSVNGSGFGGGGSQADFSQLLNLITSTIAPDSWVDTGGNASITPYVAGVFADPLEATRRAAPGGAGLAGLGAQLRHDLERRVADLPEELSRADELRVVSLRALEAAVRARAALGQAPAVTQQFLGGLTRIRYVLLDRERGDLLLAGPAEGWEYTAEGVPLGRSSGRPPVRLDDLITLCRLLDQPESTDFGCSINPRPDNLKAMKEFAEQSQAKGPLRPSAVAGWARDLETRLGEQDVVYFGFKAESRAARLLLEADYRMKLIGIGKLAGGPGIPDYFALLKQSGQTGGAPLEALRWWLTLKLDAIRVSADRSTYELAGSSVLVQSENQFISARGENLPTGASEPINRKFAENFTARYDELARRDPVFAELQNLFDLALVVGLMRTEGLARQAGWERLPFGDPLGYTPPAVEPRRTVRSVVHHKVFGGRQIVVQVAGGVQVPVLAVLGDRAEWQKLEPSEAELIPVRKPEGTARSWSWSR